MVPEGELLEPLLRQALAVVIDTGHWEQLRRSLPSAAASLLQLHERLSRRLLARPCGPHQQVAIAPGQQPVAGAGQRGLTGQQRPGAPAGSSQGLSPLGVPKGLLFQGVLQSPLGREALVEYAPSEAKAGGTRSGSLRVGDVGTGRDDSLLPPGWRVRAIDVDRGVLVLQAGTQSVTLQL